MINVVILLAALLLSPQQTGTPLKFEVASVLPDPPGKPNQGSSGCRGIDNTNITTIPLGRCVFRGIKMKRLMLVAFPPAEKLVTADNVTDGASQLIYRDVSARYRIMAEDEWVKGEPGWFNSETFTIEAKSENPETTTQEQLREMLAALVTERFKLAFHTEPKTLDGYFIVPAPGGIKLKEVPLRFIPPAAEVRRLKESGVPVFPMQTGSIIQLAIYLTGRLKMPIVNTINSGPPPTWYNFSPLNGTAISDNPADSDSVGESIFSALPERTGLKLEARKISVQVFVVDHVEKPSN